MAHIFKVITSFTFIIIFNSQLKANPDSTNTDKAKAAVFNENYGMAINYFSLAIKDKPEGILYWDRGLAKMQNKEYAEAMEDFSKATRYYKDNKSLTAIQIDKALCEYYLNDLSAALTDYSDAVALNFDLKGTREPLDIDYLAEIHQADKKDSEVESDNMVNKFCKAYYVTSARSLSSKDYHKAIEYCRIMLNLRNDYYPAYLLRGYANYLTADYDWFLKDAQKCVELNADTSLSYYTRAIAYFMQKNYQSSLVDCNKMISMDSSLGMYYYFRGTVNSRLENDDSAVSDLKNAIRLKNPYLSTNSLYFDLAKSLNYLEEYHEALEYCNKILSAYPRNEASLKQRAAVFANMDEYQKAISDLSKAIKYCSSDSDKTIIYRNRALNKIQLKKYKDAQKDLNTSIHLLPTPRSYYLRARLYHLYLNDLDKAFDDYRSTIALDSDSSYMSAVSYCLIGQKEKGKVLQLKIIDNSKNKKNQYYNMACLHSLLDEQEDALEFLKLALENGYKKYNWINHDDDLIKLREMQEFKNLMNSYVNKVAKVTN